VRDAVLRLENLPITMETFSAQSGQPASECMRMAAEADAVICIVAHRYGYVPPKELGGDGERSITWLEVDAAKRAGKPVFAFLVDPKAPWTELKEQDRLSSEPPEKAAEIVKAVQKLQEFKAHLRQEFLVDIFSNSGQLVQLVAATLASFNKTTEEQIAPDRLRPTSPIAKFRYTDRCCRVLTAAAGYTRNRRQPQKNSLNTSSIFYVLFDLALSEKLDADDATRVFRRAIEDAGVQNYLERRKKYLKRDVSVTMFDHEPLSNAIADVSTNTQNLIITAQEIARQTMVVIAGVITEAPIDTRHLVAALLTTFPQGRQRSGTFRLYTELSIDIASLKKALHLFVSERFSSTDFLDEWSKVLRISQLDIPSQDIVEPLAEFQPLIAGYVSDSTKDPKDDLSIALEVQTLCSVILAKDVVPPLSIGLFGDWGAGKTFFMDRMREEIDCITKQSAADASSSKFHSRVAQITFNAWHYVDANLWASLVSHILEKLVETIVPSEDDARVRKKLVSELDTAKELRAEAEREKLSAAKERESAESQLNKLAQLRAQKQVRLSSIRTKDLWEFVKEDADLQMSISTALESLGLPSVLNSLRDLEAVASEARGAAGRASALLVFLARDRSSMVLIALVGVLVLAVPSVAWLLGRWLPNQPLTAGLYSLSVPIVAAIGTVVRAVRGPLQKVNQYVNQLEAARGKALELVERKRNETSQEEVRLEGEVNSLKAKEISATQQLSAADARVREVEAKLREIDEGRNLAKFLLDRFQAGDYRKHLGLISTVRRDFENLSRLLQMAASGDSGVQPIQRIVLYVDDLDRCPSGRVVQVLEAVHLLLAFELFVVVVGVDPRWLLHSLEEKFPALESGASDSTSNPREWITSPQNYLEKIFQIPFSLRNMEPAGFSRLIRRLLPETGQEVRPTDTSGQAMSAGPLEVANPISSPASSGSSGEVTSSPIVTETPAVLEPGVSASSGRRRLNEDSLNIRPWEAKYAERLAAFIPTPRSAKRFANIYRLLKAPLSSGELLAFEGNEANLGDFRAVMLLLAILTGFPRLAGQIFGAISKANATSSPRGFLGDPANYSTGGTEAEQLQTCLNPLLEKALPQTLDPFVHWSPRVARFSFYTAKAATNNQAGAVRMARDTATAP
jgi:hypothetical protein